LRVAALHQSVVSVPLELQRQEKFVKEQEKGNAKSKFFTVRRLYAFGNPLTIDPALFYLWNGYCLRRSNLHTINSNTDLTG
jgi:hypothetical protein